jgi:hypothetical protein
MPAAMKGAVTVTSTADASAVPIAGKQLAGTGSPTALAGGARQGRFQSAAAVTHDVLGWLLAAAATVLAASGQVEYAVTADITDLRRFLVPAILEIAAIFLILGGYLRACDGDSPALLWLLAATVTGFATWTNLTHGGPRAGRIFAAATVVTFVLWLLKLRDRYRAARRASGLIDAPTAKFRLIRWTVMPRLTGRAWLLAVEYSLRDADDALDRARLWHDTARDTYAETAGTRRHRRAVAHRAASLAVRSRHHDNAFGRPVPTGPITAATVAPVPASTEAHKSGLARPEVDDSTEMQPGSHLPLASENGTSPATATDALRAATPISTLQPTAYVSANDTDIPAPDGTISGANQEKTSKRQRQVPSERLIDVPAGETPEPSAGTGNTAPEPYEPTSDEDRTMYQTWLRGVANGHEPTGADLARASGRPDDSTGTGRRAARRYRDAHPEFSAIGGTATPDNRELRRTAQPAGRR